MAQITFALDDQQRLTHAEWVILVKCRANWTCNRCGHQPPGVVGKGRDRHLHAHHVNHDPTDDRLSNGECLCISCHAAHHRAVKNAFRDPSLQRELSRRANAGDTAARSRNAYATFKTYATDAEKAARTAARVDAAASQSASALRDRALKGWETRGGKRTHCARGHEFDERNTYIDRDGYRNCRQCKRESHYRRKAVARDVD